MTGKANRVKSEPAPVRTESKGNFYYGVNFSGNIDRNGTLFIFFLIL